MVSLFYSSEGKELTDGHFFPKAKTQINLVLHLALLPKHDDHLLLAWKLLDDMRHV